jgi:hypothetical protein
MRMSTKWCAFMFAAPLLGLIDSTEAYAAPGVFVQTQSGAVICDVLTYKVGCWHAGGFPSAPIAPGVGRPYNMAIVNSSGGFEWNPGDIGSCGPSCPNGPLVMTYGSTYRFNGWSVKAAYDGTRFTNDSTGHGMFVSLQNVYSF